MPVEPTLQGPIVDERTVTFRLDDPDRALRSVRLYQEVRIPGDRLDFRHDGTGWVLAIDRPEVDRMEYLLEVTAAGGSKEMLPDPANPTRVGGAFGDKSVLELPGYVAPGWLDRPGPAGKRRELTIAPRSVQGEIPVTLWSPDGLGDRTPAPLLVVHDGPEYDELAGLTAYLSSLIATGALLPVRAALLGPGHRDERYSADGAYTRALCLAVLPRLRTEVPTSATVGVGASLGALAMLYAQRQNAGCLRRAVPAVRVVLPPAPRRARAPVRALPAGRAQRRFGAARGRAPCAGADGHDLRHARGESREQPHHGAGPGGARL